MILGPQLLPPPNLSVPLPPPGFDLKGQSKVIALASDPSSLTAGLFLHRCTFQLTPPPPEPTPTLRLRPGKLSPAGWGLLPTSGRLSPAARRDLKGPVENQGQEGGRTQGFGFQSQKPCAKCVREDSFLWGRKGHILHQHLKEGEREPDGARRATQGRPSHSGMPPPTPELGIRNPGVTSSSMCHLRRSLPSLRASPFVK